MRIIQRGAEAVLFEKRSDHEKHLVKKRIEKVYRIKELDIPIRKQRTKKEAKLLAEARALGIKTPQIYDRREFEIDMEFIEGEKVKDILCNADSNLLHIVCAKIGEYVGKLHSADIIHGDLTTSNFIIKGEELFLIDFGLGFHSKRPEDKSVDLYLLYQALNSTHFNILKDAWSIILNAYKGNYENAEIVISGIEKIRKRGRYR